MYRMLGAIELELEHIAVELVRLDDLDGICDFFLSLDLVDPLPVFLRVQAIHRQSYSLVVLIDDISVLKLSTTIVEQLAFLQSLDLALETLGFSLLCCSIHDSSILMLIILFLKKAIN